MKKFIPALILIVVCVVSALLLSFVHGVTYVDTDGTVTPEVSAALSGIYGSADDFDIFTLPDGVGASSTSHVTLSLKDSAGETAFLIESDGYNKDGLTLLIGLDKSGAVKGVQTVESLETPGLGSRTNTPQFEGQFVGYKSSDIPAAVPVDNTKYKYRFAKSKADLDALKAAVPAKAESFKWDAITGATMSSNGMFHAVQLAVATYSVVSGDAAFDLDAVAGATSGSTVGASNVNSNPEVQNGQQQ
jgi:electron transport complex protein RnfG